MQRSSAHLNRPDYSNGIKKKKTNCGTCRQTRDVRCSYEPSLTIRYQVKPRLVSSTLYRSKTICMPGAPTTQAKTLSPLEALCTWIMTASDRGLSHRGPSRPSSTFLLRFFRPLLANLIIFCAVIKSQMLNKVCAVSTVPQSPPAHITYSVLLF